LSKGKGKASQPHKKRKPVFHPEFKEDLLYWMENDWNTAYRAMKLIDDILNRDPFTGTGKPEHLIGLPDTWSRRLTHQDRIVYMVRDTKIDFLQARYHY